MTHAEAQACLGAYLSGGLDRESTRGLHAHLKECEACQSHVRLQHALGKSAQPVLTGLPPETQAAMARNRDLLVKILLLLVFGWAVFKMRH